MTAGLRVSVVGSGPSGAFVAQELAAAGSVDVDVFERLPVPYGLVRYGVAPDHERIKSIVDSLADIFARPGVRFVGNVDLGADVSLADLRRHYDAVVIASGSSSERSLEIPGEQLPGVCSAGEFVSWYSGHPDSAVDRFALTAERAIVVGLGNVALDVARMLCRTPDELRRTDVPEHVVDTLAASSIREIVVVGRRAALGAKFSNKELGELRELTDTTVAVDARELPIDDSTEPPLVRRMLGTLRGYADSPVVGTRRTLRFAFARTPVEIVGDTSVEGLRVRCSDGGEEIIPAEFLLRSIGYLGRAHPGLPFDPATATIPNVDGRVLDGEHPLAGVYVAGWIKRGPSGVIGTNKKCAAETVAALLADQARPDAPRRATEADLVPLLRDRRPDLVNWSGWQLIDAAEHEEGRRRGRGRVKLHERTRLLAAAAGRA